MGRAALRLPRAEGAPETEGSRIVLAPPGLDHGIVAIPRLDSGLSGGRLVVERETLPLPAGFSVAAQGAAVLGNIDSDGTIEIQIPAHCGSVSRVLSATRDPDGGIGPLAIDPRFGTGCEGSSPGALLASGDIDKDGFTDYVLSGGVYFSRSNKTSLEPATLPLEPDWREAVVADFDGDGLLDIAAARADRHRIDVLHPRDCSPGCGWVRSPIDLPGKPRLLVAAQLDGFGPLDLAFGVDTGDVDRIEVAFGGDDGLGALHNAGIFTGLERLEAAKLRSALGHCDEVSDLILGGRFDEQNAGFVFLEGSAKRALYAPLALGDLGKAQRPVSAVLAKMGPQGKAWLLVLTDDGGTSALHAAIDVLAGGAISTDQLELLALPALCDGPAPRSALLWTAADLHGDGTEEVLGIEGVCLSSSGAETTRLLVADADFGTGPLAIPGAPVEASSFVAHDLDGDSLADLVLAGPSGVRIWWGDAEGWTTAPVDLPFADARSLALLDADERFGKELAVLAAEGVTVLRFADRTPVAVLNPLHVGEGAIELQAADVNGDGVDDLVISDRERLQILLGVAQRGLPRR
jgi:hypothetical protein